MTQIWQWRLCVLLGAVVSTTAGCGSDKGSSGGGEGGTAADSGPGASHDADVRSDGIGQGAGGVTTDAGVGGQGTGGVPSTDAGVGGQGTGGVPSTDAGADGALPRDAALPPPRDAAAPAPDASLNPEPLAVGSETCVGAPFLAEVSAPMETPAGGRTQVVAGAFGGRNDYNPLQGEGLPPSCSIVYDAVGRDVVFSIALEPGQTLVTRLVALPDGHAPGIYLLDDCEAGTWPDVDGSTLCGDNEYGTPGRCNFGYCDPFDWRFTWPAAINGVPTHLRTFSLVVDEVGTDTAESFSLEWGVLGP